MEYIKELQDTYHCSQEKAHEYARSYNTIVHGLNTFAFPHTKKGLESLETVVKYDFPELEGYIKVCLVSKGLPKNELHLLKEYLDKHHTYYNEWERDHFLVKYKSMRNTINNNLKDLQDLVDGFHKKDTHLKEKMFMSGASVRDLRVHSARVLNKIVVSLA